MSVDEERQVAPVDRIDAARRVIESRLDEDVPLEELAKAAHYSMFHFHRLFRGVTGETVREHTRRLRLERAAYHLSHTDQSILQLALQAGYDSHEAFTRAFKSHFNVAPSVFREERRTNRAERSHAMQTTEIEARIERREPVRIAYVRHVGPYEEVGEAWKALCKWGWSKLMFGKAEMFGLCFDDPEVTPAERIRYEACLVVGEKAKPKPPVQMRELPGGAYAVTLHEGPFEGLAETYARLLGKIVSEPIDGRRWSPGDPPSLEKYLNDPRKTPPEKLRTEVWMPVA